MTLYYRDTSGEVNERVTKVGNSKYSDTRYAGSKNGVIYIQDKTSGRYVTFKAYVKAFSLNIVPSIELEESIFMIDPFISRGQSLFRYNISLDVPANDADEALSNMTKMQELFRYVGTLGITGSPRRGDSQQFFPKATEYNVYFSNLINKGDGEGGPPEVPFAGESPSEILAEHGVTGIIKKVEFKPSLDVGFFKTFREGYDYWEYDDTPIELDESLQLEGTDTLESGGTMESKRVPATRPHVAKHYVLDLELLMINSHDSLGATWPFMMSLF